MERTERTGTIAPSGREVRRGFMVAAFHGWEKPGQLFEREDDRLDLRNIDHEHPLMAVRCS